MMHITEDTPPDMLTGAMDLTIHLPNGETPVKMSVNRSTPMMDLLVQVTTTHRLQPSGHIIQALGFAPNQSQCDTILPYKPNTPIGALDTKHIKIVPKTPTKYVNNKLSYNHSLNNKSTSQSPSSVLNATRIAQRGTLLRNGFNNDNLPFESTFRLQVHLPRNQLYVIRVSQYVLLDDIMKKVCADKNLDETKYEFRHPANFHEVLDPKLTLSDYQLTEVTLVQKGKTVSVSDMATLQREEERRRQQTRNGGGVFNLIFKRGKSGSGSLSSDTRSISPTRSDSSQSRSVTPPAIQTPKILETVNNGTKQDINSKPKAPARKRRPAPPPPVEQNSNPSSEQSSENILNEKNQHESHEQINKENGQQIIEKIKDENILLTSSNSGLTICHSRNSSDSSGYHEASILSDTINTQTLPRKNKYLTASSNSINQGGTLPTHFEEKHISKSLGAHSKSTSNLTLTNQKKKRAPPPPPLMKSSVSVFNLNTPSTVTEPVVVSSSKSSTVDTPSSLVSPQSTQLPQSSSLNSITGSITSIEEKKTELQSHTETKSTEDESIAPITPVYKEPIAIIALEPVEPPPEFTEPLSVNTSETNSEGVEIKSDECNSDLEWQYQLPSPPSAFRDCISPSLSDLTNENVTISSFKSNISSPELLQKLKNIQKKNELDLINTVTTNPPEEFSDNVANLKKSELSLDKLERRKSEIIDKQLANIENSIKNSNSNSLVEGNVIPLRNSLLTELEQIIKNTAQPKVIEKHEDKSNSDYNSLPNFKLTTYNEPKRVINIFEDDSVRSNVDYKNDIKNNFENEKTVSNTVLMKRSSGISERDMNIMNTIQSNQDFKKPVVVEIKKKVSQYIENTSNEKSKSLDNLSNDISNNVQRSDSFHSSNKNNELTNPVKRSKSHISLNKYKQTNNTDSENLARKTSSQWDISELQSLQVMRTILPKLTNSQPNSPQKIVLSEVPDKKVEKTNKIVEIRKNRFSPPSINLGTWTERPKSQISIKLDSDYRIGGINARDNLNKHSATNDKLEKSNATSNDIYVNSTHSNTLDSSRLNKFESAIQKNRFSNYPTSFGFKRPDPITRTLPRPHSIALETYQDLSRVPIVRSVELKKNLRTETSENNEKYSNLKSQTLDKNFYNNSENINSRNKSEIITNKETLEGIGTVSQRAELFNTKIGRGNSFLLNHFNSGLTPVVKGFRTLPAQNVPQEQQNKIFTSNQNKRNFNSNQSNADIDTNYTCKITINGVNPSKEISSPAPPPPPVLPKVTAVTTKRTALKQNHSDPRDQLLDAIRNFGKNNLRPVKH